MKECAACKAPYGQFHDSGCDMEPCSQCKRQKIACDCPESSKILIPVGWNPVHDSNLWEEFCVPIKKHPRALRADGTGFPGCGLCENSGEVEIHGGVKRFCICPNGRAIKTMKRPYFLKADSKQIIEFKFSEIVDYSLEEYTDEIFFMLEKRAPETGERIIFNFTNTTEMLAEWLKFLDTLMLKFLDTLKLDMPKCEVIGMNEDLKKVCEILKLEVIGK